MIFREGAEVRLSSINAQTMNEAGVISKEAMNDKHAWLFLRSRGVGGRVQTGQTLEASFSAVSTLNFAGKNEPALRARGLHNLWSHTNASGAFVLGFR